MDRQDGQDNRRLYPEYPENIQQNENDALRATRSVLPIHVKFLFINFCGLFFTNFTFAIFQAVGLLTNIIIKVG